MIMDKFSRGIILRPLCILSQILHRNRFTSKLIKLVLGNPLYKGVFILGSGTAIAQLIGIVTTPIITRLYAPSDMGTLALYSSVLTIISACATLRYEFAYALPKNDEEAINLFGLGLVLLCVTTTAFALVLLFGRGLLIDAFDLTLIEQYLWLLLIGFFGTGLYTILNYWAVRQRDYERITYTKVNQGIGGSVIKILLGVLSLRPIGLIIGQIVSQIAGISTLARAMWKKEGKKLRLISLNHMKSVAKTYKSFPIYNLPASIVNALALQLPPLLLIVTYDPDVVGFYALANMLVILPGSFISGSMGQAYLGEASKMIREGPDGLLLLYTRTLKHLFLIGTPLIGIPALFAPVLIPFIFGELWSEVGWYIWSLAAMGIAHFIISGIGQLAIYGYNHWSLVWNIVRIVGVISSFYLSHLFSLSAIATITIYSYVMVGMYILLAIMVFKAIESYMNRAV